MTPVLDFAALAPEINSGRMYAGAGSGSLVTAAAAWSSLAAELKATAASYSAVIAELTGGPWVGASSASMAAAAAIYVSWISATAGQAEQTAAQLGAAVAAYEAAFAATVPPAEIEVNRALLAALVDSDVLGQNAAAIAATEAQYARMWAQDTAAMLGYAGASAAATTLSPFTSPQQNTNPSGAATQAAAVGQAAATPTQSTAAQLGAVPDLLNQLATGTFPGSNALLDFFNSYPVQAFEQASEDTLGLGILSYGVNFAISGVLLTAAPMIAVAFNPLADSLSAPVAAAASDITTPATAAPVGSAGAGASAGLGEAMSVGTLSVPSSWGNAPAVRLTATALPAGGFEGVPAGAGATYFGGMPAFGGPVASVVNAPRGEQPRSRLRHKVVPAIASDPCLPQDRPEDGALSERDELNQLRRAVADVARQRDVLKRTAATLIQEATDR